MMGFERESLIAVSALVLGVAMGGALVGFYTQGQIDSLNSTVQELKDERDTVTINYTERRGLTDLFKDSKDSVVSVRAYGSDNAQGSGFIYDKSGHIVTNEHVIEGSRRVEVTFTDGTTKNARIIGDDPYTDLAVLKVNKKDLKPLELADSSRVQVGQDAVAIGNPFGLRSSITSGIVSQKGRMIQIEGGFSIPNVLQTDAAINPGNSGGPLMNIKGDVIGVNTAIESRTGTFNGVGFSIPSNTVKRVVPKLISEGDYGHPWIGVSGIDVNPEVAEAMNLNDTAGFLVVEVVEDSPAAEAGLEAGSVEADINGRPTNIGGDVITHINGEEMRGISDILTYLARDVSVGDTVTVTVIRDGEPKDVELTLDSRPNTDEEEE